MKPQFSPYLLILSVVFSLGCKDEDPLPVANFNFTGSGCTAPCMILFENTSLHATSYIWHFGDGTQSTQENPQKTYNTGGAFDVMLIATGKGGIDTLVRQVLVQNSAQSQLPTASFTVSNNGCKAPCNVGFNNTSTNATSYQWNFGNGQTSTVKNPTHTFNTGGTYTVTLRAINAAGNQETQQNVTIQAAPTKVRITRITITNFPGTKSGGGSWDNNPITGNYLPDIYATLTDVNSTVLFNTGSANRKENASPNTTYFWNINYLLSNLGTAIYVDLWDYDDTSSDEFIGWTGPWNFASLTTYPSTRTVTANGITATLNLQWE